MEAGGAKYPLLWFAQLHEPSPSGLSYTRQDDFPNTSRFCSGKFFFELLEMLHQIKVAVGVDEFHSSVLLHDINYILDMYGG